jgi:hypothetical protein
MDTPDEYSRRRISRAFLRNVNTVKEALVIRAIEQADVQPAGEVLANAFRGYPCVFRSWKAAIPTDAGPGFRMMPGRV